MEQETTPLARLVTPTVYQSGGRQHVFPSATSLQWFIRQHRDELVKRGALLRLAGRTVLNAERMDEAVLSIGAAAVEVAA